MQTLPTAPERAKSMRGMMLRQGMLAAASLASLLSAATPAAAQLAADVAFRVDFRNQYLDRGVVLATVPVLAPTLDFALGVGGGKIGFGATLVMQPSSTAGRLLVAPGNAFPMPVEAMPFFRISQPFAKGSVLVDVLASYRVFPNDSGLTKAANTGGVAVRIGFPRPFLHPSVLYQFETGAINGSWLEAQIAPSVTLTQGARIGMVARGGLSIDQYVAAAPARFTPFGRKGLATVDLTGYVAATMAGLEVKPYLTMTYAQFPATAETYTGVEPLSQRFIMTVGTSLSIAGSFGGAPPPPPPAARGAVKR